MSFADPDGPAGPGVGIVFGVQTVSLTWQHAGELAGALAIGSALLRTVPTRLARVVAPFAFEAAILAMLYALWQLAGAVVGHRLLQRHRPCEVDHALRARRVPAVRTQRAAADPAAPAAHAGAPTSTTTPCTSRPCCVFLLWLFVRHREHYRPVRATMAWATLFCLLVQLIPVAPPRMLPGFVDTAVKYGQSVYAHGFVVDQLSAMPSVHVAWAVVVGWYAVQVSTSRWRWLAVGAHGGHRVLRRRDGQPLVARRYRRDRSSSSSPRGGGSGLARDALAGRGPARPAGAPTPLPDPNRSPPRCDRPSRDLRRRRNRPARSIRGSPRR